MKKFKVFEQECWGKDNWMDEEYYCDVEGNSLKEAMEDFNNEQYHECEINDDTITMYIDGDWETPCTREYRFEEVKELSEDDLEDLAQDLLAAHWGSLNTLRSKMTIDKVVQDLNIGCIYPSEEDFIPIKHHTYRSCLICNEDIYDGDKFYYAGDMFEPDTICEECCNFIRENRKEIEEKLDEIQ